eukprot:scaffold40675_cov47-Phaeocystis_antarctica.AAC.3
MQPIHAPQLKQVLLQELRAVLHSLMHSRFFRPLNLLLHSRLLASSQPRTAARAPAAARAAAAAARATRVA